MSALKLFVGENIQGIELQQIGNINEVPMSFDMLSNFTISKVGLQLRYLVKQNRKSSFSNLNQCLYWTQLNPV